MYFYEVYGDSQGQKDAEAFAHHASLQVGREGGREGGTEGQRDRGTEGVVRHRRLPHAPSLPPFLPPSPPPSFPPSLQRSVSAALRALSSEERQFLRMKYGLDDGKAKSTR